MTPSSAEGGGLALPLRIWHRAHPRLDQVVDANGRCIFVIDRMPEGSATALVRAANHFPALVEALESIAKSTCCGSCQEAALVARAALSHAEQVKP